MFIYLSKRNKKVPFSILSNFVFRTLPYEATIQEALKHEEVRIRMDAGVKQLQHFSEGLMNSILSSADKIP